MKRSFIFLILCALAPLSVYAQEVTPNKSVSSKLLPVHISNDVALHVALDKSSRTKSEQKMSSQLLELRAQYKANGSTFSPKGIRPQSADQVSAAQVDQTERIHTYVYVPKTLPVAAFVKMLQRKGIAISAWNKALNIIQVWATVKQLDELAAMTQVRTLEIVTPPMHNTGPVLSEGVSRMHADVAQTVMAAQANGIHVGVMSDDCGSVENLVAPRIGNELAAAPNDPVVVVDNLGANRTHEGLAMMEIVQDVAPLAKLYFATASTGYVNFFNNINALATVDACRVITDDIIYLGEPVYEDGSVNTLIDALAAANNVVYTSASTNAAGFTWTGTFQPDAALQGIGGGGATNTVCDFAGAGTFTNQVVSGGNITITLHWDDQFGNSKNDYDLFVVNSTNTALVASSTSVQNDGSPGNPFEAVSIGPAGTYKIIIRRTSVSAGDPNGNARIKLSCWQTGMQYVNPPGSTFGHPTAANAIGCGAIGSNRSGANQAGPVGNESNYNQIEPFSSLGPCQLINFGAGL
ncbi:MAG TPA: hypothetical protein VET48_11410, partial [Steroidobacteraceae bacterium]|nr:hypothetical protein [Steroidobacteraceae bacterium]